MTISELAREANGYLYRERERDLVLPVDSAPGWFTDLCRRAHGDYPPDDWRYEFIQDALTALEEGEEVPDLDSLYPYTADRLDWLSSRLERLGYCDEAMENFGRPSTTEQLIAWGMVAELEEVFAIVLGALESRWEELEAGREDDQ